MVNVLENLGVSLEHIDFARQLTFVQALRLYCRYLLIAPMMIQRKLTSVVRLTMTPPTRQNPRTLLLHQRQSCKQACANTGLILLHNLLRTKAQLKTLLTLFYRRCPLCPPSKNASLMFHCLFSSQ